MTSLIKNINAENHTFLRILRTINYLLMNVSSFSSQADTKKALRCQSLSERLSQLRRIDLSQPTSFVNNTDSVETIFAETAFQLGQVLGLLCGENSYAMYLGVEYLDTPEKVKQAFPGLAKYLNKETFDLTKENNRTANSSIIINKTEAYNDLCTKLQHSIYDTDCTLQEYLTFFIDLLDYCLMARHIFEMEPGFYTFYGEAYDIISEKKVYRVCKHVAGLAFDETKKFVILLRKESSAMNGLLDVIDCHTNPSSDRVHFSDKEMQALIVNEFKKHTDIETTVNQWQFLIPEYHMSYTVTWLCTVITADQMSQLTLTNNDLVLFEIEKLGTLAPLHTNLYEKLRLLNLI